MLVLVLSACRSSFPHRLLYSSSTSAETGNRAAEAYPERGLISLKNPKAGDSEPRKDFFFDAVFGPVVEQKYIYDVCASGVVESVLSGYNGTIFAYGQVRSTSFLHDSTLLTTLTPFVSLSSLPAIGRLDCVCTDWIRQGRRPPH